MPFKNNNKVFFLSSHLILFLEEIMMMN